MKSISEQLRTKMLRRPPVVIYPLLGYIWKILYQKKLGFRYEYHVDPRKDKRPHIVLANHTSRLDYIYTGIPLLPHRYSYVAGYNEFFRSHLQGIFRLLQIIPKRNFVPDIYTIISIKRVLNQKGRIVLFPEGMSSISGANQPIALGTAKLLKHLSVPVYSMVIKGGYLTNTKYNLTQRRGRVEVIVDKLFEPDEINTMDEEAITSKINNTLYHDDFAWNQDNKISYQGFDKLAENIGDLLYLCPRCFAQHSIIGVGNDIVCHKCGPLAHLENTYELVPLGTDYQMPETISGWHRFQREQMREEIKDPSFELKAEIELGILPDTEYLTDQTTSLIVGSGLLTLNHQGLAYVGTKNHQPFSFFIKISDLPTYGMCTDISRFYTFLNGEFHEFYPRVNHVMRWFIATEELHRYHGGLWSDFNFLKKY